MVRIVDRPPDDQLIFLRVVAEGYASSGAWPVWQWVARQVRDRLDAVDPRELLRGLPEWSHNYRTAYVVETGGRDPGTPSHRIALTVAGMFHAADPTANELMMSVVTAVGIACEVQADARPLSLVEAVPVRITASDLTREVAKRRTVEVNPEVLLATLKREPWVWSGITEQGGSSEWWWDLDVAPIQSFHGVDSAASYLNRMQAIVGYPEFPVAEALLGPNALAEAFDHLNLAWRLVTGSWLLRVRRLESVAILAEEVVNGKDFQAACVALSDTLDSISLEGEGRSLGRLSQHLSTMLDDPSRAEAGVDALRHVNALRNEVHSGGGAAERADRARTALGMERFGTDWEAAWNHIRHVTVDALRVIRDELSPLLPS